MNTPAMLFRTASLWLAGLLAAIVVVSAAVPDGASMLVILGFVTASYDHNLFSVRVAPVPWTDPTVWFSVQTLLQTLAVSSALAAVVTLFRTNPWQHGVLPDSTPPPKPRKSDPAAPGAATVDGAQGPPAPPAPPADRPQGGDTPPRRSSGGSSTPRGMA